MLSPPAGRPVTLHIYNFGGIFSSRRVIKGEDKLTTLYFAHSTRSSLHWTFDLHTNAPDGPLLCRAQSSYNGPPLIGGVKHGPTLSMTALKQPVKMERKRGAFNGTVFFEGPDQKEYRWQTTARLFSVVMKCFDAEDAVMATYRVTPMSLTKDGALTVQPTGQFMLDLLVATSLAMRTPNN